MTSSLVRGSVPRPIVLQEPATDHPGKSTHAYPQLDPQMQALIGERLRLYYADLLTDPVPTHFVDLIDRFIQSKEGRS